MSILKPPCRVTATATVQRRAWGRYTRSPTDCVILRRKGVTVNPWSTVTGRPWQYGGTGSAHAWQRVAGGRPTPELGSGGRQGTP